MENKKSEEELDRLHDATMLHLYETFEDEFDLYFKFYEASMEILVCGDGTFPFSGRMDNALGHIEKALAAIEANLLDHLTFELKSIYHDRNKFNSIDSYHSASLKNYLSLAIKKSIKEIIGS
jgi:hypothetical protein